MQGSTLFPTLFLTLLLTPTPTMLLTHISYPLSHTTTLSHYTPGNLLLQNAPTTSSVPTLLDARVIAQGAGGGGAADNTVLCYSPVHDAFYLFVSRLDHGYWLLIADCWLFVTC